MNQTTPAPAWLVLADGAIFKGKSFGAKGTVGGEICFNTGMTGYQEIFTDPSYYGQLLVMNTIYVGNYGVNEKDVESNGIKISGLICKNISNRFSRMIATDSLQNYFLKNAVVAIYDIDTRALVQHIRSKGAMNALISTELIDELGLKKALKLLPDMAGLDLSAQVTTKEAYTLGNAKANIRIAVLDYGIKTSILNCLEKRNTYIKVFPSNTSFEKVEVFEPHGYFLSNGPGDPSAMTYTLPTIKAIINSQKPLFGICLGHQLMAIANGIPTYKMHHGHRGLNHPVLNLETGVAEITSQNHGFGIDPLATRKNTNIAITHINLNDDSIEGIRMKDRPALSVQYHPEAGPGPHDSRYLFDSFVEMMKR